MTDVFISYAHEDLDWVREFAAAIEAEGFSTWWDPDLLPGNRYREAIAQALQSAPAVIVVWSAAALASDWVRDEAEDARQAGKLVPVLKEPVAPPHGFRQLQTADLTDWHGKSAHPQFRRLIEALKPMRPSHEETVFGAGGSADRIHTESLTPNETTAAKQRRYALRFAWRWLLPAFILVYAALVYLLKTGRCHGPCSSGLWNDVRLATVLLIAGYASLRLGEFLVARGRRFPMEGTARYAAWTAAVVAFLVGAGSSCYGLYGIGFVTGHTYYIAYRAPPSQGDALAVPAPATPH